MGRALDGIGGRRPGRAKVVAVGALALVVAVLVGMGLEFGWLGGEGQEGSEDTIEGTPPSDDTDEATAGAPLAIEVRGSGYYVGEEGPLELGAVLERAGTANAAGRPVHLVITASAVEEQVSTLRGSLESSGLPFVAVHPEAQ